MFLTLALIVFVVWVVGFAFFRAAVGGAIHILLLIVVIALVWHFASAHRGGPRHFGTATAHSRSWLA